MSNPEAILRKTRTRLKKTLIVETSGDSQAKRSLASEFEVMADKTLREFSAPTTANIRTGPAVNVGENGFELKMQVHTYNTFWRSAAPSHLREYLEMLLYSAFSYFHYWGKQNSGSMPTKIRILHGINVQLLS
jgi:hypothetical protein